MTFTEPRGLLLLLFFPLFVLLLRLALRRRRVSLASFHLLRELVDALPLLPRSHVLRKRLQTAFLLAAVASLGLAAGDPLVGAAESTPVRVVAVLDPQFGFEPADEAAGEASPAALDASLILRRFRSDDRVLLLRADTGRVTEGFVPPRRAAAAARRQRPSDLPLDREAAEGLLGLLDGLHRPDHGLVLTAVPERWEGLLPREGGRWSVVSLPAPPPGPNYAILDVDLLPDLLRPGFMSLYCRVGAFDPAGAQGGRSAVLSLSVNGHPVERREIDFGGRDTAGVEVLDLAAGEGLLELRLEPSDHFPGDNTFLAPVRSRPFLSAHLVTTGNHPLESALRSLPGLSLTVSAPGDEHEAPPSAVTILDGYVPRATAGSTLLIRPFGGMRDLPMRGEALRASFIEADATHPLLEGVSFSSLDVERMPVLVPGQGMEVVARADGHPLVMAGRNYSGERVAVVAFDPVEEGWIYDQSFPILVANLVSWLGIDARGARSSFRVGERAARSALAGARGITDPLGVDHVLPPEGEGTYTFSRAGRYRIKAGSEAPPGEVFANLLNEDVSRAMAAGPRERAEGGLPPARPFRLPLQGALILLGLAFLVIEIAVAPPAAVGRLPR